MIKLLYIPNFANCKKTTVIMGSNYFQKVERVTVFVNYFENAYYTQHSSRKVLRQFACLIISAYGGQLVHSHVQEVYILCQGEVENIYLP